MVLTIVAGWSSLSAPDPGSGKLDIYLAAHPAHAELLTKSYVSTQAYGAPFASTVAVVDDGQPVDTAFHGSVARLTTECAALFVDTPLEVVVENARNDGDFFQSFLRAVDTSLVDLFAGTRPPVKFVNGGGVTEIVESLPARAAWFYSRGLPPRMIVLVDSDRKFPGHSPKVANKLTAACIAEQVTLRVLEKRAIENYLSDDVLDAYAHSNSDVSASVVFIRQLSSAQRDYFPIKVGVTSVLGGDEAKLYAGLDLSKLASSKLPNAMTYFLSLGVSPSDTELVSRDCLVEMQTIARDIRAEL